jgi:hypothetical protein
MKVSARIAISVASLLILAVSVVEVAHLVHFGHFFPFGLHADVVIRKADFGIQGITKTYEAKLTNFGIMPARVTACTFISDTLSPVTQSFYTAEKWNASTSNWENIFQSVKLPTCPHVIAKRLWLGQSISSGEEAIAARGIFAIGDRARFVVFAEKGVVVPTAAFPIDEHRVMPEPKETVRLVVRISKQDAQTVLSNVESVLQPETDVPLRWPSIITAGADEDNPLYVNLLSADRASYNIELGWVEGCTGGNACHYGTVRGSVAPISENEGVRVPVKLSRGIRGYFIDSTCGAHCDDSAIGWTEGKFHYSVSIKAEKKETLIKVVNSAITAGHR